MEVRRFRRADLDSSVAASRSSPPAVGATGSVDSSRLKVSGSKTVKIGVGADGGVALDQTLHLVAEGELSPGVRMKARLSDGDMPLSSQGSSAALREVDEIFVEVESRRWRMRLGDQDWTIPPGIAPGAERKLRGFSAAWKDSAATVEGTLGGPQAVWKRVVLPGSEGRQEGYALASWQGGLHGVVVPGSERVRINGETMRRGADADYQVRYSEGLLDFTTRRRISAGDVIEVEFQSAEMDYERTFAAGRGSGRKGAWSWEAWAAREADDASSPLVFAQDSSTLSALAAAGSDSTAARTADGQILPLPSQTGEAGMRLRLGDSTNWIAVDLRGGDRDPNVVSGIDAREKGLFGASALRLGGGRHLREGGLGRVTLGAGVEHRQAGFKGITATDSLGTSAAGNWSSAATGRRTAGNVAGSWQAAPGLGIALDVGGRDDDNGWTTRSTGSLGLDRGADRKALAGFEWNRLDDGAPPLDRVLLTGDLAWPVGDFVPMAKLFGESKDRRTGLDGGVEAASLGIGTRWKPKGAFLESEAGVDFRRDAVGTLLATSADNDTSRSVGARTAVRWSPVDGDLDVGFDWKRLRTRQTRGLPWVESSNWLGSATAGVWPVPGLRAQGQWKLSSSSYQPEIARYDTVPAGTGAWKYDTLLRIVVPSDEGDLRLAGSRLDTTRDPVLASRRSLSFDAEVEPRRMFRKLGGFLADIGARGHAQWEETDSTGPGRIVPHFTDDALARAIDGRSELSLESWWARGPHRLEIDWRRTLSVQSSPTLAKLRDLTQEGHWSTTWKRGHRLDLVVAHGDLRDAQPDRLRLETNWTTDPSLGIRVLRNLEIRPGWRSRWGDGSEGKAIFQAGVQAPYATLRADLPKNLSLRGEVRRVRAQADPLAGSRLTEGYPDGTTWRTSANLDWAWKDHVNASAEWVARKEPDRPWFQKLSMEARAVF